jgi:3-deoxy-D-manno-octulosonate 8-phosphate phosphatase (KDO 8-P phosphatase)
MQPAAHRHRMRREPTAPLDRFAPELLWRAQGIRAAIFDVDGVLTDGRIYIGADGEGFKAFSTLDGHGLKLLARAGITPVVITGRDAPAVRRRMADLGIAEAHFGIADKLAVAEDLLKRQGLAWSAVAAMGDDWPDVALLRRAGLAVVPPGAHPELLPLADHITRAAAGFGAARECCDLLLTACGAYARWWAEDARTEDGSLGLQDPPTAAREEPAP